MSAADVAALFHDPIGRTKYDPNHTGESEWRVDCGCGNRAYGFTEGAAETSHRRHRQERAESYMAGLALLNAAARADGQEAGT